MGWYGGTTTTKDVWTKIWRDRGGVDATKNIDDKDFWFFKIVF